ncbi:MAG TPA: (d)CMP kinase [Clostridiaceae bacterium]|jgi:cytidylate kinase|nr:(d)CMP kinase [Clostridiaceae bacterium]
MKIRIAIDGPAGAGKSTIAKIISERLNIRYLDTGAMYRTVALKAIRSGIDTRDRSKISQLMENINLKVLFDKDTQRMYLDGEDVTDLIRSKEVSVGASDVAVILEVRLKLVELQREIARENGIVMDGRDIGTYVLPDAEYKIFLTATPEERAKRRYNEMISKGVKDISLEAVKNDIEYRDKNDSTRKMAPLKKADDAVEIDTTNMSALEVAEKIISMIKG